MLRGHFSLGNLHQQPVLLRMLTTYSIPQCGVEAQIHACFPRLQLVFSAIHNAFAMTKEKPSLKCQFMCVFPFKNDQNAVVSKRPTVTLKLIRAESTSVYSYFMLLLKKVQRSNKIKPNIPSFCLFVFDCAWQHARSYFPCTLQGKHGIQLNHQGIPYRVFFYFQWWGKANYSNKRDVWLEQ